MSQLDADAVLAAFDLRPDVNYLNSAGQTPRLHAVLAAGARAWAQSSQPWTQTTASWQARPQALRRQAAALFGCRGDDLALVSGVAYGSATAAANLPLRRGQSVLTLAGEHPSAVNAWAVAARHQGALMQQVERADGESWTDAVLAAIRGNTAVVAVPACHWLDGRAVDLPRVAAQARAVGAALVVDATQAIGVLALDLAVIDPDFLVAAGHKWLLGAAGLAYLYVAPRHQQGRPLEEHAWSRRGGLRDSVHARALTARLAGAARFDAGGVAAGLPLAVAASALEQLSQWTIAGVHQQLQRWQQDLLAELRARGMDDWIVAADHPHLCALRPPAADAVECRRLANGLARKGIIVAARGSALRISPYLHSSDRDAEQLVEALALWQGGAGFRRATVRRARTPRGP